ncbi:hypothetical protein E5343_10600 [Rodentibacter caecimuris]|uniref:hypothetical protein n=1 Tax=Rodentibacter caecimuris TaxID=1796644 RepID=UPI001094A1C4|nr:hypothetical protein [Pasteurella caecimuris]MCR1837676.1 hypothetical protein [Pasteurella caecimuris]MCU0106640.1 hypothetical protein [Pasteurella caecimuris]TGY48189.1 hypothetical protein E5343_10600 [Pasteurella caecimuris]
MAISIYSLTDDNHLTAYYAVVKIQIKRQKITSSRYFDSDKATARRWAVAEEIRLKMIHGEKVSNTEKATYHHQTALQESSQAKIFNNLLKAMRGRKQQEIQGATA